MKIGIITFHAAHNFGSMLQAYSLKTTLSKTSECNIINFRTENQKDIYAVFTRRKGLKYFIKNTYSLFFVFSLKKKHKAFEEFLRKKLECGDEIKNSEQINKMNFDKVVAGSDQIWNVSANDFEWLYFLEGVNVPKIAYAPSCGPSFVESSEENRLRADLSDFSAISVRDNATKEFVENNSNKKATIVCDPVLLLDRENWKELADESTMKLPQKYIFFYTLDCSKRMKKIVKEISKALNMPIVTPHNTNQHDLFMSAKKKLDSGPIDFLKMVRDAEVVVTSSFHAMIFSIIFAKQFYIIDGMKDNRKKDVLEKYGLVQQSIDGELDIEFVKAQYFSWNQDFTKIIKQEQENALSFIEGEVFNGNM